jgi:hypothetical protein
MSRDEEAKLTARAEDAHMRFRQGVQKTRALIAQYRTRLLMLRAAADRQRLGKNVVPIRPRPVQSH